MPGSPLFPIGLEFPESLLTNAGVPAASTWTGGSRAGAGTIVQRWTNGWCTTMWETDSMSVDKGAGTVKLLFGKGGQQTGRGFHIDGFNTSHKIDNEQAKPTHSRAGPRNPSVSRRCCHGSFWIVLDYSDHGGGLCSGASRTRWSCFPPTCPP